MRRIVRLLVAVDVVVLLAALALWSSTRDDERANVVNEGLRGSTPPQGQRFPELPVLEPELPDARELRGAPVQLVATCLDCRSGDLIGGYLGRLTRDDVPDDVRILLVGWEGDLDAWARRWHVDDELVSLHAATDEATVRSVRRTLGIAPVRGAEESGITYLYDTRGRWRATYFLGQLDAEDIRHDLGVLSRS